MRETLTFRGIVLRSLSVKDNDKYLDVLAQGIGRIPIYAHGARSYKNKNSAASELLRYSEFTVDKKLSGYTLRDSYEIAGFHGLSDDLASLGLAQYLGDVVFSLTQEETPEDGMLTALVTALHHLSEKSRDPRLIKAVGELRFASDAGFMPELGGCSECGKKTSAGWLLDIEEGSIVCSDCAKELPVERMYYEDGRERPHVSVSGSAVAAMRHIISSEPKRSFDFRLGDEDSDILADACERYLLYHTDREYPSLKFYRSVK